MSSTFSVQGLAPMEAEGKKTAIGGLRFDWLMVVVSTIFVGGLYLDGWAHNHGRVDQSFFTPWHAFFYGGFLLTALVLGATVVLNRGRGYSLYHAIPDGYKATITGLLIFAAGGLGDLGWHTLFGIEDGIEALFSPTHLLLGTGLALVVSGPLRATWRRQSESNSWQQLGPAVLSATLLICDLTFFQFFAHPIVSIIGGARHYHFFDDVGTMAGILALLVMSALLIGPTLLVLRRWALPAGSLTLIWGVNTVAMTILDYGYGYQIPMAAAMIGAIVIVDLFLWRTGLSLAKPDHLRLFAFAVPFLFFGAYFAVLAMTEGIGWTIHIWGGVLFLTGVVGLLLSYLLVPPVIPQER